MAARKKRNYSAVTADQKLATELREFATGYFGIPGEQKGRFTVHIVRSRTRQPVCGVRLSPQAEFAW